MKKKLKKNKSQNSVIQRFPAAPRHKPILIKFGLWKASVISDYNTIGNCFNQNSIIDTNSITSPYGLCIKQWDLHHITAAFVIGRESKNNLGLNNLRLVRVEIEGKYGGRWVGKHGVT